MDGRTGTTAVLSGDLERLVRLSNQSIPDEALKRTRRETRNLVPYAGANLIRFNGIRKLFDLSLIARHPDKNAAQSRTMEQANCQ
jgi:hypothetical protein